MIFVFTMLTAGVAVFSFTFSSMTNDFASATDKNKLAEKNVVKSETRKTASLASDLKANIGDVGSIFSDFYSAFTKSENEKDIKRIVKPVKLPTDRQ